MNINKSEGTTEFVLSLFGGTVLQTYDTLDDLRNGYVEGLKTREPESMEMYRLHTLVYKERIEP